MSSEQTQTQPESQSTKAYTVAGIREKLAVSFCLRGSSADIRKLMENEGADMTMKPGDFLRQQFPDCNVGYSQSKDEYNLRPKMQGQK